MIDVIVSWYHEKVQKIDLSSQMGLSTGIR
jgi:hypothetical protein